MRSQLATRSFSTCNTNFDCQSYLTARQESYYLSTLAHAPLHPSFTLPAFSDCPPFRSPLWGKMRRLVEKFAKILVRHTYLSLLWQLFQHLLFDRLFKSPHLCQTIPRSLHMARSARLLIICRTIALSFASLVILLLNDFQLRNLCVRKLELALKRFDISIYRMNRFKSALGISWIFIIEILYFSPLREYTTRVCASISTNWHLIIVPLRW